ncbi:DUF2569 domain-containing protein [Leptospira jelokensis]|uniref:DUF2569 domain-containing protein n=1 Tax=Leptospira jelokensis TaxID=2484931 RepID=A0A4Z1A404_9LEPT|nr:DUF2569 domain-containing protein [Leptospira jelokensis]TGL72117.1 DUF2569 domain-containing protein [Leptospira jelokensis]
MSYDENLKGLKGWLVLVGIGLVIFPIRLGYLSGPLFYNMFTDGSFEYLTTPGTESYHPLWKPLLFFEASYNALLLIASLVLLFLFVSKHYLFPKGYALFLFLPVVILPLDLWLASLIPMGDDPLDPSTLKEMVRSVVAALIWIPYMFLSKRVKATFVEGKSQTGSMDSEQTTN